MSWRAQAACRGADINAAFTISHRRQRQFITEHCDVCPVRQDCLDDAMRSEATCRPSERFGIRGGLHASARARLGRERPTAATMPERLHPLIVAIMAAEDEDRAAQRQAGRAA